MEYYSLLGLAHDTLRLVANAEIGEIEVSRAFDKLARTLCAAWSCFVALLYRWQNPPHAFNMEDGLHTLARLGRHAWQDFDGSFEFPIPSKQLSILSLQKDPRGAGGMGDWRRSS